VELKLLRFVVSVEIELVCPLTVELKPFTVAERFVSVAPFVVTVVFSAATVEFDPPTVVLNPLTVALKLFTVVCSPAVEPVEATIAASEFTCVVSDETELLIELRSELKLVTWLIEIGSVAYCVPGVPVPPPPPPPEFDTRTRLTVSGVVLGGTCQTSLHAKSPLLLAYATE
jgi:hypothetical protein